MEKAQKQCEKLLRGKQYSHRRGDFLAGLLGLPMEAAVRYVGNPYSKELSNTRSDCWKCRQLYHNDASSYQFNQLLKHSTHRRLCSG
jgi:hypothetical protein